MGAVRGSPENGVVMNFPPLLGKVLVEPAIDLGSCRSLATSGQQREWQIQVQVLTGDRECALESDEATDGEAERQHVAVPSA